MCERADATFFYQLGVRTGIEMERENRHAAKAGSFRAGVYMERGRIAAELLRCIKNPGAARTASMMTVPEVLEALHRFINDGADPGGSA